MAKSMLFPNFQTYILAGVGSQSQETFQKIEKIAKQEIASFTGLTDVFYNETIKSAANTDGFTHNPASFQFKLYNNSTVNSLNGSFDNNRSKRSNLNFYDESGFAPDELFATSEPFAVQNSDFRLGGDVDVSLLPKQIPNQLIYASSASSTETYFYRKYSDIAKKMLLGDKRYFIADISADVVINATFNGKLYPVSLLSQETVDSAIRDNPAKGLREYKNVFTNEGSDQQIIKRAVIVRNSETRPPTLANKGKQLFVLAVDPARTNDNAICTIGEFYEDPKVGWKMKVANSVCWSDKRNKQKKPLNSPDQIKDFKRLLVNYNGNKSADYEHILKVLIDSGAGGGGISTWADTLLESWKDSAGNVHKGFIDKNYGNGATKTYEPYSSQYPNNDDATLMLVSPQKLKSELFDALIEMMKLDLISFPDEYDSKGFLTIIDKDNVDEKGNQKVTKYNLSDDEIVSLINIDLLKEELVNIYSFKNKNGTVSYDLPKDKKDKMHDDRAYTMAMLAWYLKQLRRENITNKPKVKIDVNKFFMVKKPKII